MHGVDTLQEGGVLPKSRTLGAYNLTNGYFIFMLRWIRLQRDGIIRYMLGYG